MTVAPAWTGPPVHVIGLGVDLGESLTSKACAALTKAELVIGSARHLAAFPELRVQQRTYPSPMDELWSLLRRHQHRRIVLLASGDPLFYGIGAYLNRYLAADKLIFHPNITSVQAAFARINQPWHQARVVSLHGRPLDGLRSVLRANRLYALLTDQASHPGAIARLLTETGFGAATLWIAEDLGTPEEQIRRFSASALAAGETEFSSLNVVIVKTAGVGGLLPEFPGIPDQHFSTGDEESGKGMLSKREVRLNILSLLSPRAAEVGWDVGAGCGGVAVEWARLAQ